jgi:hypothetical protein
LVNLPIVYEDATIDIAGAPEIIAAAKKMLQVSAKFWG